MVGETTKIKKYKLEIKTAYNKEKDKVLISVNLNKDILQAVNFFVVKTDTKNFSIDRYDTEQERYLIKNILNNNLANDYSYSLFEKEFIDNNKNILSLETSDFYRANNIAQGLSQSITNILKIYMQCKKANIYKYNINIEEQEETE